MFAAEKGHVECLSILLAHEAAIEVADDNVSVVNGCMQP